MDYYNCEFEDCFHKILKKFNVQTVRWEGEDPCHDEFQVTDKELDFMILEVEKKLLYCDNSRFNPTKFNQKSSIEVLPKESVQNQTKLCLQLTDESSICSTTDSEFAMERIVEIMEIDCSFADVHNDVVRRGLVPEFQQFEVIAVRFSSRYRSQSISHVKPKVFFHDTIGFFLLLYDLNCNRNSLFDFL